jgi:SAM-dependent methyltransferase
MAVPEMMFGTRELFQYAGCTACGALTLLDPPPDPDSQYPADYYSFEHRETETGSRVAGYRRFRTRVVLRLPVRLIDSVASRGRLPAFFQWFAGQGVRVTSSILDVGSGGGKSLVDLARHGFTNLRGVDPHLDRDRRVGSIELARRSIDELEGNFDVVMLNHTLEHLPAPRDALATLRNHVAPGGTLLVRTPVADSWAARTYGVNWVQIDAPRHTVVPTEAGILAAAELAGLRVVRSFRDSSFFQFWGSEQYQAGMPLRRSESRTEGGDTAPFSDARVKAWEKRARELNARGEGDSAAFVLEPT